MEQIAKKLSCLRIADFTIFINLMIVLSLTPKGDLENRTVKLAKPTHKENNSGRHGSSEKKGLKRCCWSS